MPRATLGIGNMYYNFWPLVWSITALKVAIILLFSCWITGFRLPQLDQAHWPRVVQPWSRHIYFNLCEWLLLDIMLTEGKATKCNDCNIILNSEEQARSHYGGKGHQNRLKDLGITVPENVPLNGLNALQSKFTSLHQLLTFGL